MARSQDGIGGWEIDPRPLLKPGEPDFPHEAFGCEDPRLTYLQDENEWIIAYTAYSPNGPAVALARTKDFRSVERLGLALSPNNKDAAVFPRRFNGRWAMLHRPVSGEIEHIWIAYSPDLVHWGSPACVLPERGGPWWDGVRVGAGTVPIETPDGWLLIYHGVKMMPAGPIYRLGLAMLDKDNPSRLLVRCDRWAMSPTEHYERYGDVPNVVFTCGALVRGDDLWLYYGAADACTCLATVRLSMLADAIEQCQRRQT